MKKLAELTRNYFYWKDVNKRIPNAGFASVMNKAEKELIKFLDEINKKGTTGECDKDKG